MKLLTINTHSHLEQEYERKCEIFVDAILRHRPDVIAMQEVNQSIKSPLAGLGRTYPVKEDNHAMRITKMLYDSGVKYNYFWYGIKTARDIFEEGVAILSLLPVSKTDIFRISRADDSANWKTRYALGVKIDNDWFYSVHMGRHDDKCEPFDAQWERVKTHIDNSTRAWVMGDFNCPDDCGEYKNIINSGWYDTFDLAQKKSGRITVPGNIDGWRDDKVDGMRIDYIITNHMTDIKSSATIFDGENEEIISDHYGVIINF